MPLEHGLLDRAYMLNLTAPELTVLIGGMRALDANVGGSQLGVFTDRPGTLTNDFFANLLDMGTEWTSRARPSSVYEGRDRGTGEFEVDRHRSRPRVRLALAAPCPRRGLRDATTRSETFVRDFVAAWDKVMSLDRFDLR